ncbi:unnamed protein product [Amoebophrya sp. A25]|nr:unnamed protein product [Amoebophrya sp. A25]|eukprot:GSA25T00027778001.1
MRINLYPAISLFDVRKVIDKCKKCLATLSANQCVFDDRPPGYHFGHYFSNITSIALASQMYYNYKERPSIDLLTKLRTKFSF